MLGQCSVGNFVVCLPALKFILQSYFFGFFDISILVFLVKFYVVIFSQCPIENHLA